MHIIKNEITKNGSIVSVALKPQSEFNLKLLLNDQISQAASIELENWIKYVTLTYLMLAYPSK